MKSYVLFFGLVSLLSIIILRFLHVVACIDSSFLLLLTGAPWYGYTTISYPFTIWWAFGLLPVQQGVRRGEVPSGLDEWGTLIISTGPGALGWWCSRGTAVPSYSWLVFCHLFPCIALALEDSNNCLHSCRSPTHFPQAAYRDSYFSSSYEALNFPFALFMFRPHCLSWKSFPLLCQPPWLPLSPRLRLSTFYSQHGVQPGGGKQVDEVELMALIQTPVD